MRSLTRFRTMTGRYFDPLDPDPAQIDPQDIARGLATQFRFGGMTPIPYTVAQHSVLVSNRVESSEDKLIALLHDAGEAYLWDIQRGLKSHVCLDLKLNGVLTPFWMVEDRILRAVWTAFGIPDRTEEQGGELLPRTVRDADDAIGLREWCWAQGGGSFGSVVSHGGYVWDFGMTDERWLDEFRHAYEAYHGHAWTPAEVPSCG